MRLASSSSSMCVVLLLALSVVHVKSNKRPRNEKLNRAEIVARRREHLLLRLQGQPAECCPTTTAVVEPVLGRSSSGMALELYRGPNVTQRFHETVCKANVAHKQCRFIEKNLRSLSRCVQQYTLVYALVRDAGTTQKFRMDYISIRSGCSCQIVPPSPPAPS